MEILASGLWLGSGLLEGWWPLSVSTASPDNVDLEWQNIGELYGFRNAES